MFITESNKMKFVSFSEPSEISYFKSLDFILDYNDYKKLLPKEIEQKFQDFLEQFENKQEIFDSMSADEQRQNYQILQECKRLNYMMTEIQEIYWLRLGEKTINFPQVPSSKGFKMSERIDPNVLYLYRKDGKPMTEEEKIPQAFYQSGISIAIMEKQEEKFFLGDFTTTNELSEDRTKLMITFSYENYEQIDKYGKIEDRKSQKKKSSKKLFKIRK